VACPRAVRHCCSLRNTESAVLNVLKNQAESPHAAGLSFGDRQLLADTFSPSVEWWRLEARAATHFIGSDCRDRSCQAEIRTAEVTIAKRDLYDSSICLSVRGRIPSCDPGCFQVLRGVRMSETRILGPSFGCLGNRRQRILAASIPARRPLEILALSTFLRIICKWRPLQTILV
jgi:hypothetical protein